MGRLRLAAALAGGTHQSDAANQQRECCGQWNRTVVAADTTGRTAGDPGQMAVPR